MKKLKFDTLIDVLVGTRVATTDQLTMYG